MKLFHSFQKETPYNCETAPALYVNATQRYQ